MHIETLAVHAGRHVDPATGAVDLPLYLTTTFERAEDGSFPGGHVYSRTSNPTRGALEQCLATLEGGVEAAAFASGSAAVAAVMQSLQAGDHVVATAGYWGTTKQLTGVWERWGLASTFVDTADLDALRAAMRPTTRLVWVETPSNPLLAVTDLAAAAEIARAAGAWLAVDNTVGTPLLQRPLELGAHLVMHSTTKYLAGHSDVTGGAVVTRDADALWERLRALQSLAGAVPAPFDCWLVLRGIKSFPARVRLQSAAAQRVAEFLAGHPRVTATHYPGLPSHSGHRVAAGQMRGGFGGLLAVQVAGGEEAAMRVAARVRLFTRATSLGGAESLLEHRASVEAPGTPTPRDLLRLSVGLEHADDLIADLAQALG